MAKARARYPSYSLVSQRMTKETPELPKAFWISPLSWKDVENCYWTFFWHQTILIQISDVRHLCTLSPCKYGFLHDPSSWPSAWTHLGCTLVSTNGTSKSFRDTSSHKDPNFLPKMAQAISPQPLRKVPAATHKTTFSILYFNHHSDFHADAQAASSYPLSPRQSIITQTISSLCVTRCPIVYSNLICASICTFTSFHNKRSFLHLRRVCLPFCPIRACHVHVKTLKVELFSSFSTPDRPKFSARWHIK